MMSKLKLFCAVYTDDLDDSFKLLVAESQDDADMKFQEFYKNLSCPMGYYIYEVNKVDGYRILVKEQEE